MKKEKKEKKNSDYFLMKISDDFLRERAKYIADGDKYMITLRNSIGEDHGLTPEQVDKKRFTKEFEIMIFDYLKGK